MHSFWLIVVIVGGNVLFTAAGVLASRRAFKGAQLANHHQVAGYFLAVVGVLYSLVLGLLINNLQGKFDQAAVSAQVEADSCSDLWNFTRGLEQPERHKIRQYVKDFYVVAQSESWERTAVAGKEGPGYVLFLKIWQQLMDYQPSNERENACYQSCLSTMQELSDARSYRVSFGNHLLPPLVWWVLVIGGFLIVVFTYFFFVQSIITQLSLTVCVAAVIALNLFLVDTFEHPYRRNLHLQSQTFSFKPEVFDDKDVETLHREK